MRADYYPKGEMVHILAALTPPNRLAAEISLATGLRIGDVLSLRTDDIRHSQRITLREQKTGKTRRIRLPNELYDRCLRMAGRYYVFPGRLNERRPRTTAAVYKDIKRAAKMYRVSKQLQLSPHTLRKVWAVDELAKYGGNVAKVQQLLNHGDPAVTMIYCMADAMTAAKLGGNRK